MNQRGRCELIQDALAKLLHGPIKGLLKLIALMSGLHPLG